MTTRELDENWVRPPDDNVRITPAGNLRVGDVDADDGDVITARQSLWGNYVVVRWASLDQPQVYHRTEDTIDVVVEHWAEKVLREFASELQRDGRDWLFARLNRMTAEARAVEATR